MSISYLLLFSGDPYSSTWIEDFTRSVLRAFQQKGKCVILEDGYAKEAGYPVPQRITIKFSGEDAYESLVEDVLKLAEPCPRSCFLRFVPGDTELLDILQDGDLETSYYFAGVGDRMIAPRNTSASLLHKPTGLVVRCDTHRRPEQNLDEARRVMRALIAGQTSGKQVALGLANFHSHKVSSE